MTTRPRRPPGRHPHPRTAGPLVAVALALALIGGACSSSGSSGTPPSSLPPDAGAVVDNGPPRTGGRIAYAIDGESPGWNPGVHAWGPAGYEVARALFDTLTAYDTDRTARPNLAASLTPSADFTTWTIALRPGVHLHNGAEVTAELVRDDLDAYRVLPRTAALLAPIDGVEAADPLTLVVHTATPWATLPYALAGPAGMVADPDWLRSGRPDGPIGSGPFVLATWQPGTSLRVVRNPDYWRVDANGVRLPYLDEVDFRPMTDPDARGAALQAGTVDLIQTTTTDQILRFNKLAEDGKFQVFNDTNSEPAEVFVLMNTARAPFDDPGARRALVLATDREAFVKNLEHGTFATADSPYPVSSPWHVDVTYPSHDASAAKALVASVAASHGGAFRFSLLAPADPRDLAALQWLIKQWAEVGIEATLDPVDTGADDRVAVGAFQATLWRQFSSPHPIGDAAAWAPATVAPLGEAGLNLARSRDEVIGAALDAARTTPDAAVQKQQYGIVQQRLADDLPYAWLYHGQFGVVAVNDLANVATYSLPGGEKGLELLVGSQPLYQVWRRG